MTACHAYAAALHGDRFEQMEPGLPHDYLSEERLGELWTAHDSLITEGFRTLSTGVHRGVCR